MLNPAHPNTRSVQERAFIIQISNRQSLQAKTDRWRGDPTLLNRTEVMGLLFNTALTSLIPIKGYTKLAAVLRDLAQCLDDEEFDADTVYSVMAARLDRVVAT
jgi:hypothetical protein